MRTNTNKTNSHLMVAAVTTTLLISCGVANAQTPAPEKNGWEGTAAAGLTLTSGNSETLMATVGLNAKRKWDKNEMLLGAGGGYGKSDGVQNADFAQAYGQYNHLFSERFYGGIRLDAKYDGAADLSYRVSLTPVAGYYFIKNEKTTLSVEVGPSLVTEKYFGQTPDTYLGMRFGERLEHKLTETTKIWQYADYTPQVDRWAEKYLINIEVGISAAINKKWGLRVVGQYIYDSEPAAGRQSDDFRLIAGTEYKF